MSTEKYNFDNKYTNNCNLNSTALQFMVNSYLIAISFFKKLSQNIKQLLVFFSKKTSFFSFGVEALEKYEQVQNLFVIVNLLL